MDSDELATPRAAHLQTHNALQRLTFILERKGVLTESELAEVYGEEPADAGLGNPSEDW